MEEEIVEFTAIEENGIEDIAEEVEDISEDLDEIGEDTDEILRRIDKNMQMVAKAQKGIMIIIILWMLDKIVMWGIIKFG